MVLRRYESNSIEFERWWHTRKMTSLRISVWGFRLTAANSENSRILSYNALGNWVIKLFSGDWAPRNHPWLYKYVSFPSSQEIGFFSSSDDPLQKMIVIFLSLALSSPWFLVSVTYRVHGSRFMFSVQVSWNGWASHLRKDKCLLWYRDSNPFVDCHHWFTTSVLLRRNKYRTQLQHAELDQGFMWNKILDNRLCDRGSTRKRKLNEYQNLFLWSQSPQDNRAGAGPER